MKPIIKFNSIVISITTVIMYSLWALLSENIYSSIQVKIITVLISYFTSLGFYKSIFWLLSFILHKSKWFKKVIYGSYYLEGIWVGFFIGKDSKVRYFYEVFEQSLEEIIITGKAFREDDSILCIWKAKDPVFDVNLGKMTYYYESDAYDNTFINPGFATFNLERTDKDKSAFALTGFSSDLYNPGKLIAFEKKLDGYSAISINKLVEEAKKVYAENKVFFNDKCN